MVMGGVSMGGMVATLTVMREQEMWQARPVPSLVRIHNLILPCLGWSFTGHIKLKSQRHAYIQRRQAWHPDLEPVCLLLQILQAVSAGRLRLCRG